MPRLSRRPQANVEEAMVDVFSREKRSQIMSRVKGSGNALTELRLIETFRSNGLVGWRRNVRIFGRPDFVFPHMRIAIFVDGCFWHCCPQHGTIPASNQEFWVRKLNGNKKRDRLVVSELRKRGWKPVRIWQHEFRRPDRLARRLKRVFQPN